MRAPRNANAAATCGMLGCECTANVRYLTTGQFSPPCVVFDDFYFSPSQHDSKAIEDDIHQSSSFLRVAAEASSIV
jgi:hypothetical protein